MGTKLKPRGNGKEFPEVFSARQSNVLNHMEYGDAEAVRAFFTAQPQWLQYYYHGWSLLHFAVEYDQPEVVEVFLDLGLDVNTPQANAPWCAIDEAVLNGHLRTVKVLLERGATTVRQYNGFTFSCYTSYATECDNFEMVKLLVDHGAPVDVLYGDPPHSLLTTALRCGCSVEMMRLVLVAPASGRCKLRGFLTPARGRCHNETPLRRIISTEHARPRVFLVFVLCGPFALLK